MNKKIDSKVQRAAQALLAAVTLFPFASLAAGTTAHLTWTNPTQYTDGSTLPASDIAFLTITACEKNSTGSCINQKITPLTAGNVPTSAIVNVICGDYNFTMTVTTTSTALYPNSTSGPAGPVPYASGVSCSPKAATGLGVS